MKTLDDYAHEIFSLFDDDGQFTPVSMKQALSDIQSILEELLEDERCSKTHAESEPEGDESRL
jgi:hypothetical protein